MDDPSGMVIDETSVGPRAFLEARTLDRVNKARLIVAKPIITRLKRCAYGPGIDYARSNPVSESIGPIPGDIGAITPRKPLYSDHKLYFLHRDFAERIGKAWGVETDERAVPCPMELDAFIRRFRDGHFPHLVSYPSRVRGVLKLLWAARFTRGAWTLAWAVLRGRASIRIEFF